MIEEMGLPTRRRPYGGAGAGFRCCANSRSAATSVVRSMRAAMTEEGLAESRRSGIAPALARKRLEAGPPTRQAALPYSDEGRRNALTEHLINIV